jgi:hypothetical protein
LPISGTGIILNRPFYFIVVLWGERFRDYFLDLCLPTLLAPHNLPALATRSRSKLLLCTRPDDWAVINGAPLFQIVQRYVDPVYLEIPPCPADTLPCVHMGIGHKRSLQIAYEAQAYPFVITPDSMFSDGTVARLQELANKGVELVLVPALRFAEEPFFNELQGLCIAPRGRNGLAEPISLTSRQLVHAALASMHSETMTYEWDAPYFHATPSAIWWRVPGEDGIVVHSMSWAVPLLDFAAIPAHDTSALENWTIDGDYVHKNLGSIRRIHLVLDSDEMFIASWAQVAEKPHDLTPQRSLQWKLTGNLVRKARFNSWFRSGPFDPLKQRIFFAGARWHSAPLNQSWPNAEERALTTLLSCVVPPTDNIVADETAKEDQLSAWQLRGLQLHGDPLWLRLYSLLSVLARLLQFVHRMWINRTNVAFRIKGMLRGDRMAWKRAAWRFRHEMHLFLGRPFHEPEPR